MEYSVILSWRLLAAELPGSPAKSGKSVKRVEVAITDRSNGSRKKKETGLRILSNVQRSICYHISGTVTYFSVNLLELLDVPPFLSAVVP